MGASDSAREAITRQNEGVYRGLRQHVLEEKRLALVKAPPGSGKTYLLLRTVDVAVRKKMRVAVGAQTNSQADDICCRLASDYPHIPVYRFAATGLSETNLGKGVRWIWHTSELPFNPCVVVATVAKWGLIKLDAPFDFMFVDEAWQMGWADFMLCGQVSGRFVLIGDPGQIPPVVSIPVERWETSPRAPHQPAPEVILADKKIERTEFELPSCRRLPADAVDLVRPFYDFAFSAWAMPGDRTVKVKSNGAKPTALDRALESVADGSVAALTLPTPEEGPPLDEDTEIAELAARTAVRLLEREAIVRTEDGSSRKVKPEDIGLAATHRVMNAAIDQALPSGLRGKVRVDTPERWQGLERQLMIVAHPLSSVVHPSSFDLETGRLCVMASRHKSGMIIVSRDHVPETLEIHIPAAEQAVGRPDVSGRGHYQHLEFWRPIAAADRIFFD